MKTAVKIERFDPGKDAQPHAETYEVEWEGRTTVLQLLRTIQEKTDGALSFRWNCGAGRCGSCAMEIDGQPALACKYELAPDTAELRLAPMKIFPRVKDLVVDLTSMREGMKKIAGFQSEGRPFFRMYDYDIQVAREMKRCIECGICQDVCHVLREHKKEYAGPRFAVKAASLEMHPADAQKRAEAMEKSGLGYCNVTKCCQSACPEKIRITDNAIIPMKEKIAQEKRGQFLRRIFGGDKK